MIFKKTKILEYIGMASIVGSLVFVGFEMHQSQQISSAEQDLSRAEINSELRNDINENIEIWLKGNAAEELDDISARIYANMIKNAWDAAEALSQARSRLGSDGNIAIHKFSVFLHENPGAKVVWMEMIEKDRSAKSILQYHTPGDEGRLAVVFSDLALLSQSN